MQSIRQYREIGRYVEHTYHEEDNRSKEAPDVVKKHMTPTLPLPNLGPNIERQWQSDVEGQLQSYSSSQVWKSNAGSCAGSIHSDKDSASSYYSVNSEKSKSDGDSIRSSSKSVKAQQDSGYASTNEKSLPIIESTSSMNSDDFAPAVIRLSVIPPRRESTESIISHFSRHPGEVIDPSHFFESPREAPVPPEEPERIIPVHSNGVNDPTNPRNWPLKSRMAAFWIVTWLSFTQTWSGSADSSYTAAAAEALGISRIAASLNTAAFSIGIAVGSLSGLETGGGLWSRLKETLPRPVIFWCREPVIIILGIYTVVLNVLLFVFLSAFEFIFADTYGFSSGETTLVFLSIGAGTIFSTALTPIWYKLDMRALAKRQVIDGPEATFPPESRLWPCMVASPFFAICIFWLAWTNYPSISPWSGIGACFVFGYALISIQISSFQYIIDSYGPYAASALGGITVARYGFAAGMNVASRPMFETLGVQWTLTMIGSIAAVLIPAPWIFYKYGAKVRARSRYANYA
ncbi:putative major facilitator superfamily [Diplodia seriata]|uniref:Putative major facilitator superfamily n=1 Tax=Diplodia seriata TaxID=420778 RepID=A0A0G2EAP7_9PEZI|nr:putative major facilitator superfamily [Diplodia seriata]